MAGTNKKKKIITSEPCIILKDPQLPENIGMCARSMFNYGFSDLRIINPKNAWPSEKAMSSSAGAFDKIHKSTRNFLSLKEAIKGIDILFATSVRVRDLEKTVLTPRDATNLIKNKYRYNSIGFLFGPEKAGLKNNDLSEANFIIQVPTNPGFGSLNLAMAVNIICYEWFIVNNDDLKLEIESVLEVADKKNLLNFKEFLIKNIRETGFFNDKKHEKLEINVKNIFSKSMLTDKDLLILYGIIKSLKNYKINN
jgi:tRNA/rRNA methyltransferase